MNRTGSWLHHEVLKKPDQTGLSTNITDKSHWLGFPKCGIIYAADLVTKVRIAVSTNTNQYIKVGMGTRKEPKARK
jgi:hypothetical protein